jgi:hypothetical protein
VLSKISFPSFPLHLVELVTSPGNWLGTFSILVTETLWRGVCQGLVMGVSADFRGYWGYGFQESFVWVGFNLKHLGESSTPQPGIGEIGPVTKIIDRIRGGAGGEFLVVNVSMVHSVEITEK